MYIVLALIATCALGIGLHFLLPHRDARGVAVAPGIATGTAAAAYALLQWAGVDEDSPLLWLASVGGGIIVALVATIAITSLRERADTQKKATLGI